MKILSTPIEVLAHFEQNGTPHPLRLKHNGDTIKIEQVISVTEEKLAGNRMLCFRCQSEIKVSCGRLRSSLSWGPASGFCGRCNIMTVDQGINI